MKNKLQQRRGIKPLPPRLDHAPLDYAPENEIGVVFLFSHLARRRFGIRIEKIQAGFPDCIARLNGRRVRIEFEYQSRNFLQHRHNPRDCDWLVCWTHNWPSAPPRLRIIELRKEFGLGFNVWFQPHQAVREGNLKRTRFGRYWSTPSAASEGDLLLIYITHPERSVKYIYKVAGPVGHVTAGWKQGKDWMAAIRRVCILKAPIHFKDLQRHPVIKNAGFVRGRMQGRYKASEYWPDLFQMILTRNPSLRHALKPFGPERIE